MGLWVHGLLILASTSTVISGASVAQALLDMKYSTTVSKAIDLYNRGSNSDFVYKLVEEEPVYKVNGSDGQRQTHFTIKETTCQKSENKIQDECEFKKDGMIKTCTASTNDQETTFSVVCEGIYSGAKGAGNQILRDSNEQDLEHSPKGDIDGHVDLAFAWDPVTTIKDDDDDDEEELPEEDSEADAVSGGILTFLIKETVCSKSTQQHIGECPFKEDGEVKNCTVSFHGSEDITVTCNTLTDMNNVSDNYLKEQNVKTKISKKHARHMKRRSLKLSKTKRAVNGTSSGGSHSSISCLQCIFDILY